MNTIAMFQPDLKSVTCASCGCTMGGTFYTISEVFCRECIRGLGHRFDETFGDLFEDLDNNFCQKLKQQAGEILSQSNITSVDRWWEASDKKFLDTDRDSGYPDIVEGLE